MAGIGKASHRIELHGQVRNAVVLRDLLLRAFGGEEGLGAGRQVRLHGFQVGTGIGHFRKLHGIAPFVSFGVSPGDISTL